MRRFFPSRRLVALAAVYVVVLQALLLPLAVAAVSPAAGVLCISAASDTRTPLQHDTVCPCAAGCGAQCCAQDLSGAAVSAIYDPSFAWLLTPTSALEAIMRAAIRGPQNPRAPPAARSSFSSRLP